MNNTFILKQIFLHSEYEDGVDRSISVGNYFVIDFMQKLINLIYVAHISSQLLSDYQEK